MNNVLDHIEEEELDRFEARYFDRLSADDAAAFDAELERNAELKKNYRAFSMAVSGIRSVRGRLSSEQTKALRERLRQVDEELDRKNRWNKPLLYAAAVAIMVVIVAIWSGRSSPHERLATEFSLPEPGLPVLMSDHDRLLDEIMNAYKTGQFVAAGELLRRGLARDPDNDTLHYFAGVVAERSHGCGTASEHFDRISEGSPYFEKASFRRSICLLQQGELIEARRGFSSLTTAKDPQIRQRSTALLERL